MLSSASCKSIWVRREINRANRLEKPIIPILIEKLIQGDIPLLLENTHSIDASDNLTSGLALLLTEIEMRGWKELSENPITNDKELSSPSSINSHDPAINKATKAKNSQVIKNKGNITTQINISSLNSLEINATEDDKDE